MITLNDLADKLAQNAITSRQLVEHCLANIDAPDGEGERTFLSVYHDRALAEADAWDRARRDGICHLPYAGIPISIKDLFDIAGERTTAGSHALDQQPPAASDATIVSRLRGAGFIVIGKTNMTEFAYSGLGINAHYGTPASPWDRHSRHIPGGSSSGAAVSVSDDMAAAAIGTDTGGSTRIPAALCDIVGFKPTAERIPLKGCVPLSGSLDSIGPLANTVTCCAILDSIMAADSTPVVRAFHTVGLRLGVVEGLPTEQLDPHVENAYRATLTRLSKRGVLLKTMHLPELESYYASPVRGSLVGAEALAWHQPLLEQQRDQYDPWVRDRIESAAAFSAVDYVNTVQLRQQCQQACNAQSAGLDALVMPTVPLLSQPIADLQTDEELAKSSNLLYLRNTSIANTLNCPAISIPCQQAGSAPVGFMLLGHNGADRELLSIALALEDIIRFDVPGPTS